MTIPEPHRESSEAGEIRLGIAGLGRVGATAAAVPGPQGSRIVRNHLEAALTAGGYRIAALIDPDEGHIARARAAYPDAVSAVAHDSLATLSPGAVDVIVLSTPTAFREADVRAALAAAPKLLLVEKPLAGDGRTAETLLQVAEAAGVALRINFNRRFDEAIRRHRKASGEATPEVLTCRYNKGLLNYASHMVDLLQHWYGAVEAVQAIDRGDNADDPTVSFRCDMAAGFAAYVIGMSRVAYDQFEMDIFLSGGRVSYANNGVEKRTYEAVADLYYPGYAHLRECAVPRDDTPTGGFVEYYRAVSLALTAGEVLPGCTGPEALANLHVLEAVKASLGSGGSVVQLPQPDPARPKPS